MNIHFKISYIIPEEACRSEANSLIYRTSLSLKSVNDKMYKTIVNFIVYFKKHVTKWKCPIPHSLTILNNEISILSNLCTLTNQ